MKGADKLLPGTVITGKWNGNRYTVLKSLGKGANGAVYLVQSSRGLEALKLSDNSMSITSEVNVLKHFSKVQGKSLGPRLYDTDDWTEGKASPIRSFYVMEYIKGLPFLDFIKAKGREWIPVLMLQLLGSLAELHKAGWAFGDLKPENLIVADAPVGVRIVDVGGTTGMGRSIKEFTEFFDRGYWGMGMRKADPQYDLFAAAMIALNAGTGGRFPKRENAQQLLFDKIDSVPLLAGQRKVWRNALTGKYSSAEEMKKDLIECIAAAGEKRTERQRAGGQQRAASSAGAAPKKRSKPAAVKQRKSSRSGSMMDAFIVVSGAFILYALYIYHFLLP
ncbi:protein kinase family protein [Bacillus mangrovi]|uniref:Protein kinase family protein n=1 Tax=Metabacillus mangrovi TaxID=1491830 RepID=A0A7X2S8I2_9BACI|nr:serine/threonine-protein kinase [Metabacillus mangrovi]MTH55238.1 protein kinase family protein [Metabacillus mangrovi]